MYFLCDGISFFSNFARQMEKLDAYKVDLKGLPDEVVTRSWVADDDFFAAVQGSEIQHGNVAVQMQLHALTGTFELNLQFQGEVEVLCDRCLEPMMQPVKGEAVIKVRLGEAYEDDGDMIVVPEVSGILELSWLVYEQIALRIPLSHVHSDGECDEAMQNVLMQHKTPETEDTEEAESATDPRWEALKKLISTNN